MFYTIYMIFLYGSQIHQSDASFIRQEHQGNRHRYWLRQPVVLRKICEKRIGDVAARVQGFWGMNEEALIPHF